MDLRSRLTALQPELVKAMEQSGRLEVIPPGTRILRKGQYVKMIPVVLAGLVRVYISHEDKELLLYYIQPKESCIMSFAAGIFNNPSRINAVTEDESEVLLLPVDKVREWIPNYRSLNELFYAQYNLRYLDLLNTIDQIIFRNLDARLHDHLKELSRLKKSEIIHITHQQLADELGTAREVVSRLLKKLEKEDKVSIGKGGIQLSGK